MRNRSERVTYGAKERAANHRADSDRRGVPLRFSGATDRHPRVAARPRASTSRTLKWMRWPVRTAGCGGAAQSGLTRAFSAAASTSAMPHEPNDTGGCRGALTARLTGTGRLSRTPRPNSLTYQISALSRRFHASIIHPSPDCSIDRIDGATWRLWPLPQHASGPSDKNA